MNRWLIILASAFLLQSADTKGADRGDGNGMLQLGLRSTVSLFSHGGYPGYGSGGQFRLRLMKQINTEWFADFLNTNYGDAGRRADAHIGWSVMFYPFPTEEKKVIPYILAGHCFDYTRITPFTNIGGAITEPRDKWSSAAQMGLGVHFPVKGIMDFSLSSQYMIHLGNNDLHAEIMTDSLGNKQIHFEDHSHGSSLEGHLLITFSLNFNIGELW